jgi:hypothetical protein
MKIYHFKKLNFVLPRQDKKLRKEGHVLPNQDTISLKTGHNFF